MSSPTPRGSHAAARDRAPTSYTATAPAATRNGTKPQGPMPADCEEGLDAAEWGAWADAFRYTTTRRADA